MGSPLYSTSAADDRPKREDNDNDPEENVLQNVEHHKALRRVEVVLLSHQFSLTPPSFMLFLKFFLRLAHDSIEVLKLRQGDTVLQHVREILLFVRGFILEIEHVIALYEVTNFLLTDFHFFTYQSVVSFLFSLLFSDGFIFTVLFFRSIFTRVLPT